MDSRTFINLLAERLDRDPEDVQVITTQLANLIASSVMDGNTVTMPGFGSFESKMRAERIALHPASGKRLLVPPKLSIIFKPSAMLKQKVR